MLLFSLLFLLFLFLMVESKPLLTAEVYFGYPKNLSFQVDNTNKCKIFNCSQGNYCTKDNTYQFCILKELSIVVVKYNNHSVFVYASMFLKNPSIAAERDIYSFYGYNNYWPRIYKSGSDYFVTTIEKMHFTDGSANKTGNFVSINTRLGYILN